MPNTTLHVVTRELALLGEATLSERVGRATLPRESIPRCKRVTSSSLADQPRKHVLICFVPKASLTLEIVHDVQLNKQHIYDLRSLDRIMSQQCKAANIIRPNDQMVGTIILNNLKGFLETIMRNPTTGCHHKQQQQQKHAQDLGLQHT